MAIFNSYVKLPEGNILFIFSHRSAVMIPHNILQLEKINMLKLEATIQQTDYGLWTCYNLTYTWVTQGMSHTKGFWGYSKINMSKPTSSRWSIQGPPALILTQTLLLLDFCERKLERDADSFGWNGRWTSSPSFGDFGENQWFNTQILRIFLGTDHGWPETHPKHQ